MKLKKIHLSNDRVLTCDDMKFVIGGGDEHSSHDGSWVDCPACQELADAMYYGGNAAAGYQGTNGGLLMVQGVAYLGSIAYHYLYQGYHNLFGGDENNSDDNTNDDTTENSNNNGQN